MHKKLFFTKLLIAFSLVAFSADAAPKVKAIDYWRTHNPSDQRMVDHSKFQTFIDAYVRLPSDGVSRTNYSSVTSADHTRLRDYVDGLTSQEITTYNKLEQKAYWINLYNALTVLVVLDHYPVDSITDISLGLFAFGPWKEKLIMVENKPISLNDIEHGILRPIFNDPRLHYVLNCAAYSCPNIPTEAITKDNQEFFLEEGAKIYINHLRGVDVSGYRLRISKIYDWYQEDFTDSKGDGIVTHLMKYATPSLRTTLSNLGNVEYLVYDWKLNDSRLAPKGHSG